jgi:hypothetical protein
MIRSLSDVNFIFRATGCGHSLFRLEDLMDVVATRVVETEIYNIFYWIMTPCSLH